MTLPDDFDSTLAEVMTDLGTVFTWQSNTYACTHSETSKAMGDRELGGYVLDNESQIITRKSLFPTLPQVKQTVTLKGTVYRIVRVAIDETQSMLIISLEQLTA